MAKDLIYSEDEKVVRRYNVFEGKGSNPGKRGMTLFVTNKRVIQKTFQNGVLSNSISYKEVSIENISGDIETSIDRKVSLAKIILFFILALIFLVLGNVIFTLLGLGFIALAVLAIVFPKTEGKISIYNKGMVYNGISASAGKIVVKKNVSVSILNIKEGRDFSLMQREIGYIINEIKKGTDIEKLIASSQRRPSRTSYERQYNNQHQSYQAPINSNNDDDEIPLI